MPSNLGRRSAGRDESDHTHIYQAHLSEEQAQRQLVRDRRCSAGLSGLRLYTVGFIVCHVVARSYASATRSIVASS